MKNTLSRCIRMYVMIMLQKTRFSDRIVHLGEHRFHLYQEIIAYRRSNQTDPVKGLLHSGNNGGIRTISTIARNSISSA